MTGGPPARVAAQARPVEAGSAGEDEVGLGHEGDLVPSQLGGRVEKGRQLIHAVVDDGGGFEMSGELQRHRCVVPEHVIRDSFVRQQLVEQLPLFDMDGRRPQMLG